MSKKNMEVNSSIIQEVKEMGEEIKTFNNTRRAAKLRNGRWINMVHMNTTKADKGIRLVNELLNFFVWFGKFSWWSIDDNSGDSLDSAMLDLATDLQAHYDDLQLDEEIKAEIEKALMLLTSIALKGQDNIVMLDNNCGELEVIGCKEEVMLAFEEYIEEGYITVRK